MSSDMPIEAIDVALSGDEPLSAKVRKPYTITKQREKWTETEHLQFIEALKLHGRAWRRIEDHIGTKTAVQIRSHAQKFFSKVEREAGTLQDIEVPPPRPKRKPSHPYPRKAARGFSEETKSSPTFTAAYSSNLTPMASPDTSIITEQPKLAQDEEYSTPKTSEAKPGSIESLSSFRIFGQTLHIREAKEEPKGSSSSSSSSSSSVIIEEPGSSGIVNLKLSLATAASLGTKGTKAAQTLTPPTTTEAQLSLSEEGEEEEEEARNFLVYHPRPVPFNGSTKGRVGVGVGGEALSRSGSCFKPWQPSKGEMQRGPGAESQYPCPQLLLPCPYFPTLFHIDGITALQVVSSWPSLISNPLPLSSLSLPHSSLEDQKHLPNKASASSSCSPSNSIYSETTEASESYSPCSSQGSLNEQAREEINNDPQTMPPSPSKRVRTCNEGKGENR